MHATLELQIEHALARIEDLERKLGNQAELIATLCVNVTTLEDTLKATAAPAKRGPGRPPKARGVDDTLKAQGITDAVMDRANRQAP